MTDQMARKDDLNGVGCLLLFLFLFCLWAGHETARRFEAIEKRLTALEQPK